MSTKPAFPSDAADKVLVRMPDGMRDQLKAEAKANNRTMNAEIVARLQASFGVRNIATLGLPAAGTSFAQPQAARDAAALAAHQSFAEQEHARILVQAGLDSTGHLAADLHAKAVKEREAEFKKMIAAAMGPTLQDFFKEFEERERKERERLLEQLRSGHFVRDALAAQQATTKKPPQKNPATTKPNQN